MEPLLLYPDPAPPELAQALDLAGYQWKGVSDERSAALVRAPERGRGLRSDRREGRARRRRSRRAAAPRSPRRALRKRDVPLEPLLLLVSGGQLADLELREDLFDDFCLYPFQPLELEARLKHLFWRTGRGTRPELVCGWVM